MGYAAIEAGFDPQVVNGCRPEAILRLGPVGCSMALRMIRAGQHTVIVNKDKESES